MPASFSGWLLHHYVLVTVLIPGPRRARDDRGDVPGWVMVTVMTAAVVAALMPFVEDELRQLLRSAFASVR